MDISGLWYSSLVIHRLLEPHQRHINNIPNFSQQNIINLYLFAINNLKHRQLFMESFKGIKTYGLHRGNFDRNIRTNDYDRRTPIISLFKERRRREALPTGLVLCCSPYSWTIWNRIIDKHMAYACPGFRLLPDSIMFKSGPKQFFSSFFL